MNEEGIAIRNAGLVILNAYFRMLFDRLGLITDNSFSSAEAQHKAVNYLQFIVTGLQQTEESLLVLNKVLCGIEISDPVEGSISLTKNEENLIDEMIESSIKHLPAIGQSSVDGFRGNWLVRDGILRATENRWELYVEKRAYDILMLQSPFSFSIIKMPLMQKPLHVTWNY